MKNLSLFNLLKPGRFAAVLLSFIFIALFEAQGWATTYYLKNNTAPNTLANWGQNTDGSGTSPSDFATNGDIFIINTGTIGSLGAAWQIGSTNPNTSGSVSLELRVYGDLDLNNYNLTLFAGTRNNASSLSTTSLTVYTGGLINLRSNQIIASGSNNNGIETLNFTIQSGASLKTANVWGISGGIAGSNGATLTISLSTGANYEFNGTAAQVTNGMPPTIGSLKINNAQGVKLSAAVAVTNNLAIYNGAKLNLGGFSSTTATLSLAGVNQTATGTYGYTGSGATHIDATYFTNQPGPTLGTVNVTSGVAPTCSLNLTSVANSDSQSLTAGNAITNITYATSTATGATFSGLPSGVTGSWASNAITISGSPTIAGYYPFLITLTGGSCTTTAIGYITVTPAAASKLVFTSTAVTTTAGVASGNITVQRQDQYNNPVTTEGTRTVTLTSSSTGTKTFNPTSLSITSGNSSASFTYTDTQAGTPTITAASTSPSTITSATQVETVNPAAASKLVFTSTAVTTTAGVASGNITVQRQDQYNNPVTAEGTRTVTLSSTSTGTKTFNPTSLSITNGNSSASFTYTDTQAGTPTITAASTSPTTITSATQTETVNPAAASKLVFTSTAVTTTAGVASGNITVQRQDQYNNPVTAEGTRTVTLSSTSTGTKTFNPTSLSITNGNSSASFTYTDTQAGTPTITAASTSPTTITSATQTETVNPAALDHFAISTISSPQTAGIPITGITLTAQDFYNNTVTGFASTVAYSGTAGISGTSGTFTLGQLTGVSVTPTVVGNGLTFVVTGATKTGTATFDIDGGSKTSNGDGDWNVIAWLPAGTPIATDNVTIINAVTLSATGTADCLNLNTSGGSLTLEPGASLIVKGAVTGDVSVKRGFLGDPFFQLFTPPVNSTESQALGFYTGAYLDRYDEPAGEWHRLVNADAVPPMVGYSINYAAPTTLTFTGPIYTTDRSFSGLTASGTGGYGPGWNLVGNPFTSAVDLDLGIWSYTNTDSYIYVWDALGNNFRTGPTLKAQDTKYTYGTLTDNVIPAMQGFFVHNTAAGSFTVPAAARTHSSQLFYKSAKTETEVLRLTVEGNSYTDKAIVAFNPEATSGFDGQYDAYKLMGGDMAPQLYSMLSDGQIATVNSLPSAAATEYVPLGLKVGKTATYTLTVGGTETFDPSVPIRLDDLKLGTTQDLRLNPVYSFTASPGDAENRLRLRFVTATGIDNPKAQGISIFQSQGSVVVRQAGTAAGTVYVYAATGALVAQQSLTPNETRLRQLAPGVYVVKVVTGKAAVSSKVVISQNR